MHSGSRGHHNEQPPHNATIADMQQKGKQDMTPPMAGHGHMVEALTHTQPLWMRGYTAG